MSVFPRTWQASQRAQHACVFSTGRAPSGPGAERAGLSWPDAQQALQDEAWRQTAEANRRDMLDLGLWGVPSFHVADTAVWGQDRLWAIEHALLQPENSPPKDSTP